MVRRWRILQKLLLLNSKTYFLYNPSRIQNTFFELKLLSQDSVEQDQLPKNMKNFGSNKKINFSNESVKKPANVFRG